MNSSKGYIAHFDLDSFYASVELIKDPSLKGKAVIVGAQGQRGIVTTCSYEARKFGIHSAMPMKTAIRLCPHAIVVPPRHEDYAKFSQQVTNIIASGAPLFEKASIDEFYLDLTGMDLFFDPLLWTIQLRDQIIKETGLPISFGMGSNKMVAKMATNEAKPNGYLMVPHGKEMDFLSSFTIDKIPGVGANTVEVLQRKGFKKIKDIQGTTSENMVAILGKWGMDLWKKANGSHESEVVASRESKSISNENTFEENITDVPFLMSEIVRMSEKISFELRNENKVAGCVSIKIRYPDFETFTRQVSIPFTCADDIIIPIAKDLFHKLYVKGKAVRLIGVKLSNLTNQAVQSNLFENNEKKQILYQAIDDVKKRFGSKMVYRASGK